MQTLQQFLAKRLRLKVNPDKSAVDRPWKRRFLGYSMTSQSRPRLKVAPESERRHVLRAGRGESHLRAAG